MSAASRKYSQPTLWDTSNATSSPALVDGRLPYDLQDGRKIAQSGQARARASRGAERASSRSVTTHGIFGPTSTGSLKSIALQTCLESRLRRRTGLTGSTMYSLTWKHQTTPAGRQISRLAASALTKSGSESGGTRLPTPRASMGKHMIAWCRAERGEHRSQLEDFLACMWLADGGLREIGLNVCPLLCGTLMGYPPSWLASAMQSFQKSPPSSSLPAVNAA